MSDAAPGEPRAAPRPTHPLAAWLERVLRDPNPILMRELRQSARLVRTPFILMGLTIVMTLIIAGVGGSVAQSARPALVGQALFHAFFSIAFFVVAWAGPAVAANAIASEREGRTWEALLLTGMRPVEIARGKFLAAFVAVASYIVSVAPVGGLCFLFGGVDFLEVMIAFFYLFVFAALSVAFGLAVSSKLATSRGAIVVTLLLAVPISGMAFGMFGPALGAGIHELWSRVPQGVPVWLPLAYVRGELGQEYVLILIVAPIVGIALPGWFLYASMVANLTEPSDDRSSGLKRWLIGTTLVLLAAAIAGQVSMRTADAAAIAFIVELMLLLLFFIFAVGVFMGEPLGTSRRVRHRWAREGTSALARWLGPSMERTFVLLLAGAVASMAILGVVTFSSAAWRSTTASAFEYTALSRFGGYVCGFCLFCIGLGAWLRSRSNNLFGVRLLYAVILGGLAVVPWIVAALFGLASRGSDAALLLAAPSPFFIFVLLDSQPPDAAHEVGVALSLLWAASGLSLFVAGARTARGALAAWDRQVAAEQDIYDHEDSAAGQAPVPSDGAPAPEPGDSAPVP
ncbi:MAG: ABC transporter permease [Polyangiaceae bacterium]|nr:ABC transporter permease [Polyangiaceae bacterium]